MTDKPELRVSVLSDYVCPFCFIGHHRLQRLRDDYDLKINWCLVEIHPETPPEGSPVSALNYTPEHWQRLLDSLRLLAEEEQLKLAEITRIPSSRRALLLAEACKSLGAERFYPLHNRLLEAHFVDGADIGDPQLLRDIARQCEIPDALVEQAWADPVVDGPADQVPAALQPYLQFAASIQAHSVPTYVFGKELLTGVVDIDTLRGAAARLIG